MKGKVKTLLHINWIQNSQKHSLLLVMRTGLKRREGWSQELLWNPISCKCTRGKVWVTSTMFWSLWLDWIPLCAWDKSSRSADWIQVRAWLRSFSFCWISISFQNTCQSAFLVCFLVCFELVPWLHGCGWNARNVENRSSEKKRD